jgi:hypothetical protein|tara:strand:+ start:140 stop:340 length:201 start_codon:yes stop_codon:yes gene_type:complete
MTKPGLWANIHAKRARIKAGSGEKMRSPGSTGSPTNKALKESAMKKGGILKKQKFKKGGLKNAKSR